MKDCLTEFSNNYILNYQIGVIMKKTILVLGFLLSLSGLASARSIEIPKNHLVKENIIASVEQKNKPLFYKIEVRKSGEIQKYFSGVYTDKVSIADDKLTPYIKKFDTQINVDSGNLEIEKIRESLKIDLNRSSLMIDYLELVLDKVYLNERDKESYVQLPIVSSGKYLLENLRLNDLKGCELHEVKKIDEGIQTNIKTNSQIVLKICDSEKGLNSK